MVKTEGYAMKQYRQPTKRFCQTLRLKEDPALIAAYRRLHSREEFWREIQTGIREVGILEMEIYIQGSTLFMIVETPLDFDWESAMLRLSTLPRQAEWESLVERFQQCESGVSSDRKWQLMERMFHLYD